VAEHLHGTKWSIESELCQLAGRVTISDALIHLGLVTSGKFRLVPTNEGWIRGGAETYIYKFSVIDCDNEAKNINNFILKACVSFPAGNSIAEILNSWVNRRLLLQRHGAKVPQLFGFGNGIILEDFVPYRTHLCMQLASVAGLFSRLQFHPISPFHDIRSFGTDVVLIDFGEDLGPSNVPTSDGMRIFEMLLEQLNCWGVQIDSYLRGTMYARFLEHRKE
jgi:hypothetical protein